MNIYCCSDKIKSLPCVDFGNGITSFNDIILKFLEH